MWVWFYFNSSRFCIYLFKLRRQDSSFAPSPFCALQVLSFSRLRFLFLYYSLISFIYFCLHFYFLVGFFTCMKFSLNFVHEITFAWDFHWISFLVTTWMSQFLFFLLLVLVLLFFCCTVIFLTGPVFNSVPFCFSRYSSQLFHFCVIYFKFTHSCFLKTSFQMRSLVLSHCKFSFLPWYLNLYVPILFRLSRSVYLSICLLGLPIRHPFSHSPLLYFLNIHSKRVTVSDLIFFYHFNGLN